MNFTFLKENKDAIISAIFMLLVLFLFFIPKNQDEKLQINKNQVIEGKKFDYESVLNNIEAKSFYVYDIVDKKAIFSKDEHLRLPLASITKLVSGLIVLDIMPETTIVTISRDDLSLEGDSGLFIGEKWKLKDLLDFSLITSSNDGIHAVSSALNYYQSVNNKDTVKIMNERVKALGLNDTIFINETGLDINKSMSGAYSSTYDVSMIFKNIILNNLNLVYNTNKQKVEFISESNIRHSATNTNIYLNNISGLIASKTGFTDLAGGNLAIVFDAGIMRPIVIVVMGSTIEGRFNDVVKLQQLTLEKLSEN